MKRSLSESTDNSSIEFKRLKFLNELKTITEVIEISDDESNVIRELSPADSGFKEPSTSVISTSPTNENFKTIPITKSNRSQKRGSIRIKILQEHEESLTETERILKRTLKIHNMIHPLEKISDTMNRFNPKVICSNLSNYEITRKINLGTIIPKVEEFPNEIEFRGLILHRWMSFDGEHPHYFVRWIPLNILDDEWIVADYATAVKLKKKVKLSDLNLQQRREICERIFKGVKI